MHCRRQQPLLLYCAPTSSCSTGCCLLLSDGSLCSCRNDPLADSKLHWLALHISYGTLRFVNVLSSYQPFNDRVAHLLKAAEEMGALWPAAAGAGAAAAAAEASGGEVGAWNKACQAALQWAPGLEMTCTSTTSMCTLSIPQTNCWFAFGKLPWLSMLLLSSASYIMHVVRLAVCCDTHTHTDEVEVQAQRWHCYARRTDC